MTTPPPPCPFTEAELRWLWRRYRGCTFPVGSFPKRYARHEFESLTPAKGWPMAAHLAYQYRRQIFGQASAKWDRQHFNDEVKARTARRQRQLTFTRAWKAVVFATHTPCLPAPRDPQLCFSFA